MGELVERLWEARFEGPTRADRRWGRYRAFVPDRLCGWEFAIPASLAGDIASAERRVLALNSAVDVAGLEGLGRFLLRAEAVGSSRLEGLAVSPRRLAAAAAALEQDVDAGDRLAAEVAANIKALQVATAAATCGDRFDLADLLAAHEALMRHSPTPEVAGQLRSNQNWIGGSAYTPSDHGSCRHRPNTSPRS